MRSSHGQCAGRAAGADDAVVLEPEGVPVSPDATVFGYVVGPASNFISAWGPAEYSWRVYVNGELVATKRFRLSEG